jgi:hypothetical protein
MMPGKEMGKEMSIEDMKQITDDQLGDLVDTLRTASERGIEIDPKPTNIFYDPTEGFGIVDYHSSKVASKNSSDQNFGEIVGWMSTPIMNAGFYGDYNPNMDADDYAHDLKRLVVNLDVLKRYRTVVETKLGGDDLAVALEDIDKQTESYQDMAQRYSNPDWVAEKVVSNQKRNKELQEHQ